MSSLMDRLRKVEPDGGDEHSTRWYRNPDGPEAAERIEDLEGCVHERDRALHAEIIAKSRVADLEAVNREMRGTLIELRLRLREAGRRPEECSEVGLIDNALDELAVLSAERGRKES